MAPQQPRSGERASRPGIEVINRAVDLLAAFTHGPGSVLTLAELARRTGLPKPTLHRLLAALEVQGLVDRTASGYQLGIRLFELGEHVPRKHKLREAALPFMQDLFEASHDTVHLAVLDGTDVVYLERIHGHRALNVASRVGGRLPAHCTGVGKALLAEPAFAAQQSIQQLLGQLQRERLAVTGQFSTFDAAAHKGEFAAAIAALHRLGFLEKWESQCRERLLAFLTES